MRLAVISDVHANLPALRAAMDAIARAGADGIVCLGDIVGYNADPGECIALLREAGAACVAGNHDRAVAGQLPITLFPPRAARAIRWTRRRLGAEDLRFLSALPAELEIGGWMIAVHGTLHPPELRERLYMPDAATRRPSFEALAARSAGPRICAFGHTHAPGIYEYRAGVEHELAAERAVLREDALYLLNPGTVGEPRSADRRAMFMVLDSTRRTVEANRVDYDFREAAARIRAAGLGRPRLGFVPEPFRSVLRRGARRLRLP